MLQQQLAQATGQQIQTQQQQQTTQVQQMPQATTLQAVQQQVSVMIFFVFPRKFIFKSGFILILKTSLLISHTCTAGILLKRLENLRIPEFV